MFRTVVYILISLVVITFIRMAAGVIFKGLGELFEPSKPDGTAVNQGPNTPVSGELKRDPVCGTFVPTATSIKTAVGGEMFYFCSADCRDRYAAKAAG